MLKESVVAAIAGHKRLPVEQVTLESNLEEMGIDSLEAITILFELEKDLGVEIPNEAIDGIETVGDIVRKLKELIGDGVA